MASSTDPISLQCKLCEKTYQHKDGPLMFPCLHSFCKQCLIKYLKKSADNKMVGCPTCNDLFPLPKDINQLPVNLRLSHLAKATMYEKQAEGGKVKCQKCKGTRKDATTFCCNHCKFLCEQCQDDYIRIRDDEELEFIDLSTYKKGEFKVHSPPSKCSEHPKHEMEMFCEQCTCLICLVCAQTEHQSHCKSSMHKTAAKEKGSLQEATNGVDDALRVMDRTLQQIQEMRDKVKVSAKEATNRINKTCDDLIQAVENRREILKRRCQEIAKGKDDILSNQMVEVDKLRRKLGNAQLHARDAINKSTPEELLSVKKVIESCLNCSLKIYQKQLVTEVIEDDAIDTSLETKRVVEEINKLGHFPGILDYSISSVAGLAVPVLMVGKEKQIRILLKNDAGNPVQHGSNPHLQYQLRKEGADPTGEYIPPKVTITPGNNDGSVTLGFTPDQPGEYELTFMVRNKPIGASPYQITVREPRDYKGFGNMAATKTVGVGGNCYGVAVHGNGTVYATNNSKIKVLNPDGTEGEIGDGDLSSTWSITLIGDTIYVVSHINHMVYMYSTNGQRIGGFGGFGFGNGQLYNPIGICSDGNGRVLVTEFNNNRIQVFSADGNFIKLIPCSSHPYDVAVDTIGNIHVALYNENQIAVYSPHNGSKIDKYNVNGNTRGPTGIYIDGEGNRVIGCGTNNRVIIADSTGALVATKQINNCWGVTMDKKGQIYVAEGNNNRWSVY